MFLLLGWLIYGLIVGSIAKKLHHEEDMVGWLPTIGLGVAGSFVGGFISWVLGFGHHSFGPAGLIMGVVGAVIFCLIYRNYRLNQFFHKNMREPKFRMK